MLRDCLGLCFLLDTLSIQADASALCGIQARAWSYSLSSELS